MKPFIVTPGGKGLQEIRNRVEIKGGGVTKAFLHQVEGARGESFKKRMLRLLDIIITSNKIFWTLAICTWLLFFGIGFHFGQLLGGR